MKKAVIFDIDGTLADNSHRLHFLKGKKNWELFFSGLENDTLIRETAELFKELCATKKYDMLLVSGRPNRYKVKTEKWLRLNGIYYQELFLRGDNDKRPDYIVKQEMLGEIRKNYSVEFAFDDKPQVVEMWKKNGIFCFQCPALIPKDK
jgi:FMN phosphatase YigB (HAD superfamily)